MKWKLLKEELEKELEFEHDETDDDVEIGTFTVQTTVDSVLVKEMAEVGEIRSPHLFTVSVRKNEGMIPHFHVYDAAGEHRKKRDIKKKRSGIHTCIEIRQNHYFKHGAYQDKLKSEVLEQLDKFMSTTRTDNDDIGIGMTNYEYTIRFWNNANHTKGKANWVDPLSTKPDYTTVLD